MHLHYVIEMSNSDSWEILGRIWNLFGKISEKRDRRNTGRKLGKDYKEIMTKF